MEECVSKKKKRSESCKISVTGLSKYYGSHAVLSDISFQTRAGELFGLIGPDGAGKTTLFRILTTLILPDKGAVKLGTLDLFRDYREIRKSVGYMPGRFSLYSDLTVEENLNFFATIFNTSLQANYAVVADIYDQIAPFKKRKAANLSGGMKQKLALCCALIHKPDILFLDEPTTGVDPVSRKEFWEILKKLRIEGITILVSTPYMDEAVLCDRIALIREGRFLLQDTPSGIIAGFNHDLWSVRCGDMARLLNFLRNQPEVKSCFSFGDSLHLVFKEDKPGYPKMISEKMTNHGFGQVRLEKITPGIEDCFMKAFQ